MEPNSILCARAHADISFVLVSFVNRFFERIHSTLARLGLGMQRQAHALVPWGTVLPLLFAVLQVGLWESGS